MLFRSRLEGQDALARDDLVFGAVGSLGGGGSPAGSMAAQQAPDVSGAINSAASYTRADTERKLLDANLANVRSQTNLNDKTMKKIEEQVNTEKALQKNYQSSARLNNANAAVPEVKASFLNGLDASQTAKNVGNAISQGAQNLSPTKSKTKSKRGKLDANRNRNRSNAGKRSSTRSVTPYKSKKSQSRRSR